VLLQRVKSCALQQLAVCQSIGALTGVIGLARFICSPEQRQNPDPKMGV